MATDKNFVIKNGLTVGTSEIITSAGNLTNVGSIATTGITVDSRLVLDGSKIYDNSTNGNSKGFRIGGAGLIPLNGSGTDTNNIVDIGSATYKFKDLYLSGTISSGAITSSGALIVGAGTQGVAGDADITVREGNAFAGIDLRSTRTSGNIGGIRSYNSSNVGVGELLFEVQGRLNYTGSLGLALGGTSFIDGSRNLTNIGTISSGNITSNGTLTTQADSASAGISIKRTNSSTAGSKGHIGFRDSDGYFVASIDSRGTGVNNSGDLRFFTSTGQSYSGVYNNPSATLILGTDNSATFAGAITSSGNITQVVNNVGIPTVYGKHTMEATDAQMDLVSSSGGTWGSAINFVEGASTSANTNNWSIARKTSGGGNSLNFNFGTSNQHDNPTKVSFASTGTVSIDTGTTSGTFLSLTRNGGTEIGRISYSATDNIAIYGTTASHAGLNFGTNLIIPMSAGAEVDDTVALGDGTRNFSEIFVKGMTVGTTQIIDASRNITNIVDYHSDGRLQASAVHGENTHTGAELLFEITDYDDSTSLKRKFGYNNSNTGLSKVDDSDAPASGVFDATGYFGPLWGPYIPMDDDTEIIFECWAKHISGSDTSGNFYAGSQFYDGSKTSLGNNSRYWGANGDAQDADNTTWRFIRGVMRGDGIRAQSATSTAKYLRFLVLFNYNTTGQTTRFCGFKFYRSKKTVTSLWLKTNSATYLQDSNFQTTGDTGDASELVVGHDQRIYANATTTNTDPQFTFTGDTNTGLGYIGTDTLGLIAAGSRKFYVNNTNAYFQNLSGGVSVPALTATSLDVNGNADISGSLTMSGGHVYLTNFNIYEVNSLEFNDPGPGEGLSWSGGNIKIYESPDNLTTNSAGNLQVVYGSTRRLTVNNTGIDVNGNIDATGTISTSGQISSTNSTIGSAGATGNLANAALLAGSTSTGIGIDNNEIVSKGATLFINQNDGYNIEMYTGSGASNTSKLSINTTGAVFNTLADFDAGLTVSVGGSDRFSITGGDVNVVGTTDLQIAGTSRRLSFTSGTGTVRTTTANPLILQTGGTSAPVYINHNGTSGINSSRALKVWYDMDVYNTVNFCNSSFTVQGRTAVDGSGNLLVGSTGATDTILQTNGTDRIVLDHSASQVYSSWPLRINSNNYTAFYAQTNGNGVGLQFSDNGSNGSGTQFGYFEYFHGDGASYGSGNAFIARSTESTMSFVVKGKLMFDEGLYLDPTSGTGAGTQIIDDLGRVTHRAAGSGWTDHLNLLSSDGTNKWNVLVDNGAGDVLRFGYNSTKRVDISTGGNVDTTGFFEADQGFRQAIPGNDGLRVYGENANQPLIRVSANAIGNNSADYGFTLAYRGDRSGNENSLAIYSDNQAGSQIEAINIKQDGTTHFGADVYFGASKKLFFNGTSNYGVGAGGHNYNSVYADTLESGSSTDPLELVYYQGPGVNIGSGASKPLGCGSLGVGTAQNGIRSGYMAHFKSTGDVALLLEADTDNVTETDNPFIRFEQDASAVAARIGYASGTNDFEIYNEYNSNLYLGTNNANRAVLGQTGDWTVTGNVTAYGSVSDIRRKENVEIIPNAIDKVKTLDGITFNFKDKPEERMTGVIAQQVMEVLPEAVYEHETIEKEQTYAVHYGNMVGLLIEAVKEQQKQIEELKEEVSSLRSKN